MIPVWDAFRLSVGECYMQTELKADTGTGGTVSLLFTEPERGRIFVPVVVSAYQASAGGASQRAAAYTITTSSSVDPWGRWPAAGLPLGSKTIAEGFTERLPSIAWLPRGNQLKVDFEASVLGSTLQAHVAFLNCPGEIVSMLPFPHAGP